MKSEEVPSKLSYEFVCQRQLLFSQCKLQKAQFPHLGQGIWEVSTEMYLPVKREQGWDSVEVTDKENTVLLAWRGKEYLEAYSTPQGRMGKKAGK